MSRQGALKDERGFTLVEVMIVIIVMGIVFAIATPSGSAPSRAAGWTRRPTSSRRTCGGAYQGDQQAGRLQTVDLTAGELGIHP